MRIPHLPILTVVILMLTSAAHICRAECVFPPRSPEMPQGATATDEDMKEGREALQKYVNVLQDYQNCLEKQIKDAPPDTKPEVKQRWLQSSDNAIDAAHQIADVYALQLRVFKSRQ